MSKHQRKCKIMKTQLCVAALFLTVISCDSDNLTCNSVDGARITEKNAVIRFDTRFGRYVLFHHVPGSIDSFEVYIPCNLPDGFQENAEVVFDGLYASLPESDKPDQVIAGEEFYVVKLQSVNEQSIP